jgi:hypothetical protein
MKYAPSSSNRCPTTSTSDVFSECFQDKAIVNVPSVSIHLRLCGIAYPKLRTLMRLEVASRLTFIEIIEDDGAVVKTVDPPAVRTMEIW